MGQHVGRGLAASRRHRRIGDSSGAGSASATSPYLRAQHHDDAPTFRSVQARRTLSVPSALTRNDAAGLFQLAHVTQRAGGARRPDGRRGARSTASASVTSNGSGPCRSSAGRRHPLPEMRDEMRVTKPSLPSVTATFMPGGEPVRGQVAVDGCLPGVRSAGGLRGGVGSPGRDRRAPGSRRRAHLIRAHDHRRAADDLGHRRAGGGDECGSAREGLERRSPKPSSSDGRRPPPTAEASEDLLAREPARTQDPGGDPAGGGGVPHRDGTPPVAPREHEPEVRPAGRPANGDQRGHKTLRGSSVPANAEVRLPDGSRCSAARSPASPRGRTEAFVIDAMGRR